MLSYFINLYNTSKIWLLERADAMFNVNRSQSEGKLKNKYWVETREWDK